MPFEATVINSQIFDEAIRAVAESFFHTLKTELTHQCKFKSREEAKNVIFEYIEVFYNHVRIHSANDYLSPAEFEALTETKVLQKTA